MDWKWIENVFLITNIIRFISTDRTISEDDEYKNMPKLIQKIKYKKETMKRVILVYDNEHSKLVIE